VRQGAEMYTCCLHSCPQGHAKFKCGDDPGLRPSILLQQQHGRSAGMPCWQLKWHEHQTTNLGVRSSNLFGRASNINKLSSASTPSCVCSIPRGIRQGNRIFFRESATLPHALDAKIPRADHPNGRPRNCDPERRASGYEVAPRQKPEQRRMALCRWINAGGCHGRRSDP
jgi:hypothetical protein